MTGRCQVCEAQNVRLAGFIQLFTQQWVCRQCARSENLRALVRTR